MGKMPSEDDQRILFTHITITAELKEARRKYRTMLRRVKKEEAQMNLKLKTGAVNGG